MKLRLNTKRGLDSFADLVETMDREIVNRTTLVDESAAEIYERVILDLKCLIKIQSLYIEE